MGVLDSVLAKETLQNQQVNFRTTSFTQGKGMKRQIGPHQSHSQFHPPISPSPLIRTGLIPESSALPPSLEMLPTGTRGDNSKEYLPGVSERK